MRRKVKRSYYKKRGGAEFSAYDNGTPVHNAIDPEYVVPSTDAANIDLYAVPSEAAETSAAAHVVLPKLNGAPGTVVEAAGGGESIYGTGVPVSPTAAAAAVLADSQHVERNQIVRINSIRRVLKVDERPPGKNTVLDNTVRNIAPWLYGNINRKQEGILFKGAEIGTFLIRCSLVPSESCYTLCLKTQRGGQGRKAEWKKFYIKPGDNPKLFIKVEGRTNFNTLEELVIYFMSNPLIASTGDHGKLLKSPEMTIEKENIKIDSFKEIQKTILEMQ